MSPRLVNVRLDAERLRKVRILRERGVPLSDLVREAIDARYGELAPAAHQVDIKGFVQSLFERFPDPDDLPPREYDVHNAAEARAAIRQRLPRKQRSARTRR